MDLLGALTGTVGVAQNFAGIDLSKEQHRQNFQSAVYLNDRDMKKSILQGKREHLMSTYASIESHFASTDVDLVNAIKESERDMYDQRNQQLNTIILSSTVMLGVLSTLLIEGVGDFPQHASSVESWYIPIAFFSSFVGISYFCQTMSICLCIIALKMASSYMLKKAEKLSTDLHWSRKRIFKLFEQDLKSSESIADEDERTIDIKWKKLTKFHHDTMNAQLKSNASYSRNTTENVFTNSDNSNAPNSDAWYNCSSCTKSQAPHENEKHFYKRLDSVRSFEDFWKAHCSQYNKWATITFALGSMSQLVALVVWSINKFYVTMQNTAAAIAIAIFISSAVPGGVFLYISYKSAYAEVYQKLCELDKIPVEEEV